MFRTRTVVLSSALTILLAGCSETPTDPAVAPTNMPESAFLVASIPGVTFNSASCTLTSSTTGEVRCSWDITNANGTSLDYYTEAYMTIAYNCLNNTGQIRSSATTNLWTNLSYSDVTSTSITGTNQQLPTAVPYTRTGSRKRFNACKGSQQVQITGYTMQYWHIYMYSSNGTACLASDDRMGCLVAA